MLNNPECASTALILIDMQEKLVKAMDHVDAALSRQRMLLMAAQILDLGVIVTEQYPQGLGHTVDALTEVLPAGVPVLAKNSFSCFGEPEFGKILDRRGVRTLVLAGCEAHVCVQQTLIDAVNRGFQVILTADAVTSRIPANVDWALAFARHQNAAVMSAEAAVLWLTRSAAHPDFKAISRLVR